MNGFICSTPIYEFKGWIFEYGPAGCWPLKKDGELRKKAGRKFYAIVDEFLRLPDEQRKAHRVGGGCTVF